MRQLFLNVLGYTLFTVAGVALLLAYFDCLTY